MLKRQRFREQKKFSFKKIILIFLIVVFLFVVFFFGLNFSSIRKINLQVNNLFCVDQTSLEKDLGLNGKNIFLLNESQLDQKIHKKYPCVGEIKIKKNYPNIVNISINSRKPAVVLNYLKSATASSDLNPDEIQIATESSLLTIPEDQMTKDDKVVIDDEGIVFSDDDSKYPAVQSDYIGKPLKPGEFAGNQIVNAINILNKLQQLGLEIKRSLILGDRILIIESSEKIFFSLKKDKDTQLASLQLILQKAKMDSKMITTIDLRFDKPTIVFSPKKN